MDSIFPTCQQCGCTIVNRSHPTLTSQVKGRKFCSQSCRAKFTTGKVSSSPMYANPLYQTWIGILSRCNRKTHKDYRRYGGRGIKVEWKNFEEFCEWSFKNTRFEGSTIDRINNDGNYSSDNCQWSTPEKQARNRRDNVYVEAFGETKLVKEWSEDPRCKVRYTTLFARIFRDGVKPEVAISQPVTERGRDRLNPIHLHR